MTTYRYKWERYFSWYFVLALIAAIFGFGTDFYFSQSQFRQPSSGRTDVFITHGIECWVSPPIWWIHKIGIVAFFSIFGAVLLYKAVRAFADGWNS